MAKILRATKTTLRFQIENEESLLYLTELRQITAVRITVAPNECTVQELISLADVLFNIIQKYLFTHVPTYSEEHN